MEFETLRESSILAGTDAVEHSSIAKNWTTDMQQSFPYAPVNVKPQAGGGGGYPREFDIMKLSQGRAFDI